MLWSVPGRNVSEVWWKETVTRRPSGWPGDCGAGLQNAFPKTPSGSQKTLKDLVLVPPCAFCVLLFVTPVRASRAAKYQGSAAQRLLTAPESASRFWVR